MAAPNGIVWGSIAGGYGRIGIYAGVSSTDTTTTVTVEVWFWSKYSVSDSANTYYYNNLASAGSATTAIGSVNINTTVASGDGWSTDNQQKLGSSTYTYTRGTSQVTRYLYARLINVDRVGAAMTANTTFVIPKLASYTVSYNANGGSGAPSNQTKWYGKALTLSSTKPTRTGYSFQGWATSSTGSVSYASGASYTGNASLTLYAVWKANTYTIKYNANGGSGAPSNQTKTHGVTLKLSTTVPTRTNYTFLGWATSASSTSASYSAGSNYTTNAAVTLYAVWKLAYIKPRINNLSISRIGSTGIVPDDGMTGFEGRNKATGEGTSGAMQLEIAPGEVYIEGYYINQTSTTVRTFSKSSNDRITVVLLRLDKTAGTIDFLWKLCSLVDGDYVTTAEGDILPVRNDTYYDLVLGVEVIPANTTALTTDMYTDLRFNEKYCSWLRSSDEGKSATVSFDWESDQDISSIDISWESTSGETGSKTVEASGTSGSVDIIVGDDTLSTESTYTFTIVVTDAGGYTYAFGTLNGTKFTLDFLAGGRGAAFGKPAELENVLDIAFQTRFFGGILSPVLEPETDLNTVLLPNTYVGANITNYNYVNCPVTDGTFILIVESSGEEGQVKQTYISCSKYKPERYVRFYYQSNWGDWFWAGTEEYVLYEDLNGGSNGTITLNASLSHYRYVEIYFTDNNGKSGGYTKVWNPNGKDVCLHIQEAGTTIYSRQTIYTLSGTSMTPNVTNASYVKFAGTSLAISSGTNFIKVIRVIGRA